MSSIDENLLYSDLYKALTAAVPELLPLIDAKLGEDYDLANEAPGYLVIEDIFKHFLREHLTHEASGDLVRRLFGFMERMATSNDRAVVDLLRIGLLENIAYDSVLYRLAQVHMGPRTAEYVEFDRRDYERRGILRS
jgi:hypothetical protein